MCQQNENLMKTIEKLIGGTILAYLIAYLIAPDDSGIVALDFFVLVIVEFILSKMNI